MLSVTVVKEAPDVVLELEGELDMATGDVLQNVIDQIDLEKVNSLTFSLRGLKLIDSTGIGQLLSYHKLLRKKNARIYIENGNADIEEILELIGVREIINS